MRKLLLLSICLLFLGSNSPAQDFKIIGYLPSYRFPLAEKIHYERLTHLNLSFLNPDASGNLTIGGQDITPFVGLAKTKNPSLQVFVALAGGGLTAEWAQAYKQRMQSANRSAFIHQLIQYVETHNLDGIDVDLEWSHVDSLYSPFVLELADSLHRKGKQISAAWPATTRYADISDEALAIFDWINLMAYDLTGPWNENDPGDHSPYSFANRGINFWKGQGVSAERMNVGVPFYGRNWDAPNTGQAFTYASMIAEDSSYAYEDTVGKRYYNGIPTIQAKTVLAQMETSGIMIWELGQDVFDTFDHLSLLRAIHEQVNRTTPISPQLAAARFLLYPNPFTDQLSLKTDGLLPGSQVVIRDLQGRTIFKEMWVPGQQDKSWNLASVSSGIYVFEIHTDKQISRRKLIKN